MDLDELLLSIHDFFMGLGVDEIRRRGADDDKPLRMVKTILHELCKIKVSSRALRLADKRRCAWSGPSCINKVCYMRPRWPKGVLKGAHDDQRILHHCNRSA